MRSTLPLLLGPVLGLLIARLFGPWRPVSALMSAIVGELALFGAYNAWQEHRIARLMAFPPHRDMLLFAKAHPTPAGELFGLSVLVAIAAIVAAIFLGAQRVASRR